MLFYYRRGVIVSKVTKLTLEFLAFFISLSLATYFVSATSYEIEVSHDEEFFMINGEKFEAKT